MKKEKVFIVLSHMHTLKRGSKTEWEVHEKVEFVDQVRNKHLSTASAIGDYINKKMDKGAAMGFNDYLKFEGYIRSKYSQQMAQLDTAYRGDQIEDADKINLVTDQFGNVRAKTIFDNV